MASAHSEAARLEQIITEFYAKSLQIIWESRCGYRSRDQASSSSPSSSVRARDRWFHLALWESPAVLDIGRLRSHSHLESMVVDIILIQAMPVGFDERIIERWVVRYRNKKAGECGNRGNRKLRNCDVYQNAILLLRSLYVTARLLPAYKVYHSLKSSSHILPFALAHRVSSFVEPFARNEEADMRRFVFTPVDSLSGSLCLCVQYHPWLPDIPSSGSSTPMSPQLIPDYVGSPLTDPVRSFPLSASSSSSSSLSATFTRRHSWCFGVGGAVAPSPTHYHMPPQPPAEKSTVNKNPKFDEFLRSPSLTVRIPGSRLQNPLLRSESAPVHTQKLPPGVSGNHNHKSYSGDDFELGEYDCPFDVYDGEPRSGCLNERGAFSGQKSEEAAMGELVWMLSKAGPLHQDTVPESNEVVTKTAGDALQELQGYRELKNLLITQGTISHSQI